MDWTSTDLIAFHGVRPDARPTRQMGAAKGPRGVSFQGASDRGHFYAWAWKVGTLFVETNYAPWRDYDVRGKWPEDLWWQGKLAHATYAEYSVKCRKGHAARKRDLEAVLHDEAAARVDEEIAKRKGQLARLLHPYRTLAAVEAWESQYLTVRPRYKILILHADSRAGKTSFAEALFERPFVVTVEGSAFLDLKGFDRATHDGIVLDNVNSFGQLVSWRAVLQARNAKTKGGQSATQMYSRREKRCALCGVFVLSVLATVGALLSPC